MRMVGLALGVFQVLELLFFEVYASKAGPFDVAINQVEHCEDRGTGQVEFGTKITNGGNGKYIYDNPFYLGVPVDENFKLYIEVQEWGNGGYRPRTIEHTAKNCEEIWKILQIFIKSVMESVGQHVEGCPIPAGNYTPNNWEIDFKLKGIPTMPYKKYRAIVTLYYKGEKVGCVIIYAETVPKGSLI